MFEKLYYIQWYGDSYNNTLLGDNQFRSISKYPSESADLYLTDHIVIQN